MFRRVVVLAVAVALVVLYGCGRAPTPPGSTTLPPAGGPTGTLTVTLLEDFSDRQVFPLTNWWNLDISGAPVIRCGTTTC